jgi:hypothetical protein
MESIPDNKYSAETMSSKTPAMVMVTKWYLLPFVAVAAFAYRCWYHRLVDRGYGLLYNAMKHHDEFVVAQILFGFIGIGGVILFEVFGKRLPIWIQIVYRAAIISTITFFAVERIVVLFGPTPYWHHP